MVWIVCQNINQWSDLHSTNIFLLCVLVCFTKKEEQFFNLLNNVSSSSNLF